MKKISKTALIAVLCSLSLLFAVPSFSISASAATPPEEEGIAPLADVKEWIWEYRGTHIYKRLYNHTTGEWEGDWIYVGERPGKGEPSGEKH